jgi:hypothetical protein
MSYIIPSELKKRYYLPYLDLPTASKDGKIKAVVS